MPTRTISFINDPDIKYINLFLPRRLWQVPSSALTTVTLTDDQMINVFNRMLLNIGSLITWDPDRGELRGKITESFDYLIRSTDYSIRQLSEIRRYLFNWIETAERGKDKVLVVDLANLYFAYKTSYERRGATSSYDVIMQDIYAILEQIIREYKCDRIILSIQNHNINKPNFYTILIDALLTKFSSENILIITAHNRSSSDDLHTVLCIEILHNLRIPYIVVTGDHFNDYKLITRHLTTRYLTPIMSIPDVNAKVLDPYVGLGLRTASGTKKNKKSLYKHSKKVKPLHKKHKTTIKTHRKYKRSKTYTKKVN